MLTAADVEVETAFEADESGLLANAAVDGRGLLVAVGEEAVADETVTVSMGDPTDEELTETEAFSTAKPASAMREGNIMIVRF